MRRTILPYDPWLKAFARRLRKDMTLPEVLLWNELKRGKIMGYDFDRQPPIDHHIVDFYCKDLMLAIEVDGSSHDSEEALTQDTIQQVRLERLGVHVLRFRNEGVLKDRPRVLETIRHWIEQRAPTEDA